MENSIEKSANEVTPQNAKNTKKVSLTVLIIALLLCGLVSLAIGFAVSFLVLRTNPFIIETEKPIKTEITTTPEEDGPPTLTPEVDVDDSQDVTPSVTATVNSDEIEWLTYTNQQYNFTIQFPGDGNSKLRTTARGSPAKRRSGRGSWPARAGTFP